MFTLRRQASSAAIFTLRAVYKETWLVSGDDAFCQSRRADLRRNAFAITDTELRGIASAAIMG